MQLIYYRGNLQLPPLLSVGMSFMDGLKGGCGCALPLSLFLQLRHFHCIRHANGADIHFGKRERERISNYGLLSNLHPHSRSLSLSVCPLQIPSLGGADCTSAVGNVGRYLHHVEEEDKRKKEGQFCVSPSPSRRHLDLVPPSPSLSPSLSHQGQKGPRRSPARCCRNSHGFATMNECMMHIWSAI